MTMDLTSKATQANVQMMQCLPFKRLQIARLGFTTVKRSPTQRSGKRQLPHLWMPTENDLTKPLPLQQLV
ncbi:unnamed protein product [Cylicostephanus goldi]|uniref:Uncharacterized protein n=1 Tax=Cylicostephanus goldi TaxID=71465 RepID=A0A3P6QKH6_CYLGO|nr:unnamed protein product [Cylicostephanus goldi]